MPASGPPRTCSPGRGQYSGDQAAAWRSLRVVDGSRRPGISAALNDGFRAASGELLLFADADDVVAPGWVAAMVEAAQGSDPVGGYNDVERLNATTPRAWRRPYPGDGLRMDCGPLPYAVGGNFAAWRKVLDAIGGWDESYQVGCTDVMICWRARLAGYRLDFAPAAVVHYQLRASLKDLACQQYHYRRARAQAFGDFRPHGMPRPPVWKAARAWAWVVLTSPVAAVSNRHRGKWVRHVSYRAGNLAGSARFRVVVARSRRSPRPASPHRGPSRMRPPFPAVSQRLELAPQLGARASGPWGSGWVDEVAVRGS